MEAHAILLAAGAGRRFGGGKLTATLAGKPLIAWSLAAALAAPVRTVTAVLGAEAEEVRFAIRSFECDRLRIIVCPTWSEGIAASLRSGLASLPAEADAALIFLGDMPGVSATVADRLLTAVRNGAPAALPICGDRPAHPVAIAARLFGQCRALEGDQGARNLLRQIDGVVRVAIDASGNADDVDTREELEALRQRFGPICREKR